MGVASTALIAGTALLGMPATQAADGTLTLDPQSGSGDAIFAVATTGGCQNANAGYFTTVMSGSGLREDVVLNGVTPLSAISATATQSEPMRAASGKLFDKVKEENGGRLPNGGYTISLICRAKLSSTPLKTFSGMITITNAGSTINWKTGFTPVNEPMVNVTKPAVKGNKQVGKTLRATAGTWETTPAKVSYNWKLGKKSLGKKSKLKVPKIAKGKTIRLVVVATKSGYSPGKVTIKVKIK
ncbi:MAG: hypothetical protein NWS65_04920 [Candidatus Nanopelagicales bacterium]|nr:hypothetical protein [Candidatus Nanopelagicales bacterium]